MIFPLQAPPYNRKRCDKYAFYSDSIANYFEFLQTVTDEMLRVTKRYVFLNIQKNYYNKKDVFDLIGHYSDKIVEIIIWEKSNPMPASGHNVTNAYEFFIVLGDQPIKANGTYIKNHLTTSVNSKMPKNHKAVMKEEVCDWFIKNFTKEGDMILDPFMGLGTTAICAKKANRHYIGSEISEEYYRESLDRINGECKQFTIFDYTQEPNGQLSFG